MSERPRAALDYLDMGMGVIPVGSDKRPIIAWKEYQERYPSESEIMEWWPDNGREDAGEVYVVLGSRQLPPTLDLALDPPDGAIHGAQAGDRLGNRVSAVDWDGDGLMEVLTGAPGADGPGGDREAAGEVRIVAVGPRLRE